MAACCSSLPRAPLDAIGGRLPKACEGPAAARTDYVCVRCRVVCGAWSREPDVVEFAQESLICPSRRRAWRGSKIVRGSEKAPPSFEQPDPWLPVEVDVRPARARGLPFVACHGTHRFHGGVCIHTYAPRSSTEARVTCRRPDSHHVQIRMTSTWQTCCNGLTNLFLMHLPEMNPAVAHVHKKRARSAMTASAAGKFPARSLGPIEGPRKLNDCLSIRTSSRDHRR